MSDQKYLIKRQSTYYVVVEIPKGLRARAGGQKRFKRSLKTDSLKVANDRKHAWVAEFKRQIKSLESAPSAGGDQLLLRQALQWRSSFETALQDGSYVDGPEDETYEELLRSQIGDDATELYRAGRDTEASKFFRVATGRETPIRDLSTQWLSMRKGQIRNSVHSQQAAVINRFLGWAGENTSIEQINRRRAGEYLSYLHSPASGIKTTTARRYFSALQSFWTWLNSRGLAGDANPWSRHKHPAPQSSRDLLSDDALIALLSGTPHSLARYGDTLPDLMRLGLVTGARLEELCSLRTIDAVLRQDGWWLLIREYEGHRLKSKAAKRDVPLHTSATHIAARRAKLEGGFLFPNLTRGGPDNRRSWNVSRSFSAYRKRVGVVGDGEVFHSLRNTFTEHLEGSGTPTSTIQLLIGHSRKGSMGTTAGYTKGTLVDLRAAINGLVFPPEVDRLLISENHKPREAEDDS